MQIVKNLDNSSPTNPTAVKFKAKIFNPCQTNRRKLIYFSPFNIHTITLGFKFEMKSLSLNAGTSIILYSWAFGSNRDYGQKGLEQAFSEGYRLRRAGALSDENWLRRAGRTPKQLDFGWPTLVWCDSVIPSDLEGGIWRGNHHCGQRVRKDPRLKHCQAAAVGAKQIGLGPFC